MNKLWYKNAVIYSLDVESFKDSDNDGIGDFKGLKHRLHYLSSLGINCIWLLPFYDSPNKDNGYDVRDYYQIDSRLGDFGNFVEFLDAAEEEGIRVLVDLVVNHTSDQHIWFKEARKDKDSPFRNYYIWSKTKPKDDGKHAILGAEQGNSNWEKDKKSGEYYYHTFYPEQPDLNVSNPAVRKEIKKIMHFWLKLGISGFRIDAAPHMIRKKGDAKFDGDPHDVFRDFREFVESYKPEAILLAEVDVEPRKYKNFFGDDDQMHMLFNFYLNNYIWLALATGKAAPLEKALKNLEHNSEREQMANFLRNHDELDLERLTEKEREEVFKAFAPEEDMKIFDRGIRRRLAPMLENNRQRMELSYSLLFTLPGTPVLRYGQEIGMGEDLTKKGRDSVRTLMQWSAGENGGFSNAPRKKLVRNIISKGPFSYEKINVNDQHRDPDSLLNWMDRAINFRKECPEFGWGEFKSIKTGNPAVFAYMRSSVKGVAVAVHNLSNEEVKVKLELDKNLEVIDVFGDKKYETMDLNTRELKLSAYGYRWLKKKKDFL